MVPNLCCSLNVDLNHIYLKVFVEIKIVAFIVNVQYLINIYKHGLSRPLFLDQLFTSFVDRARLENTNGNHRGDAGNKQREKVYTS